MWLHLFKALHEQGAFITLVNITVKSKLASQCDLFHRFFTELLQFCLEVTPGGLLVQPLT